MRSGGERSTFWKFVCVIAKRVERNVHVSSTHAREPRIARLAATLPFPSFPCVVIPFVPDSLPSRSLLLSHSLHPSLARIAHR